MSSGHASHKSTSTKPNPNAVAGQNEVDNFDPQPEEGYPFNADEDTGMNPAAIERPAQSEEAETAD